MKIKITYAPIQPYYTTELAALYKCSVRHMDRKLKPLRPELGEHFLKKWTTKQVIKIFEELGRPEISIEEIE